MQKPVPVLSKGRHASLCLAGGLLFSCFTVPVGAVEDLSDLSTKERLSRLEQLWENQGMADMVLRLESLQQEMQRLQGDIEVQGHAIKTLKNSLGEMEQRAATPPPLPPVQAPEFTPPGAANSDVPISAIMDSEAGIDSVGNPLPPVTDNQSAQPANREPGSNAPTGPTGPGSAEQLAYQQAFGFLKKGQYDSAIAGFNEYLTRYPQESNADNAQYWLGEAYYVKRKFEDAQAAFTTLLERYPNTAKRADATLKIGFVHYELGQWSEARKALDDVKVNYPGSAAAQLAETRLQKMKKEGH
ncbi:MAG: tol-pal system protein YbgF [Gammaproteobacteria bacterium]